jgi:quercetin dioxygenase-like cupin family protein
MSLDISSDAIYRFFKCLLHKLIMSSEYQENPLPLIRRFITTHNTEGEAIFISHAQVPDYLPSTPTGADGEIALLYATTNIPTSVDAEADVAQYDEFLHQPPGITVDGGTAFRLIDLRPGKATPMHRTVSIDYGVLIDGEVDLVLDSGASRRMHRGDVCVQRGTAHSIRNRSDTEWCRMMFVYMPMQKLKIKGKELESEVYDEGYDNPENEKGTGENADKAKQTQ